MIRKEQLSDHTHLRAIYRDYLIASGLFMLFTALYWLTISKDPTIDSYATATWVQSTTSLNWFHPHHLLFSYTFRVINWLYQALFPPTDLLQLMTRVMHILGGVVVGLFYLRLHALNLTRLKAASLAALLGVSFGIWFYATIFELVIPYLVMFLVAWAAADRWGRQNPRGGFTAGMVLGAGVLIHQTLAIYEPAFLLYLFLMGPSLNRPKRLVAHLLGFLTIITAGYLAAFLILGLDFPAGWFSFFTKYAQSEAFHRGNLGDIGTSTLNIMGMWFYPMFYSGLISFRFAISALILGLLLAVAVFKTLKKDPLSAFCLVVFGTAFLFFTWWSPTTWDFYVIPSLIIIIPAVASFKSKYFIWLLPALTAVVAISVYFTVIKEHSEPSVNCIWEASTELITQLKPQDTVFLTNQRLDACNTYKGIKAGHNLLQPDSDNTPEMRTFAANALDAHNTVYFDNGVWEVLERTGNQNIKLLLKNRLEKARIVVNANSSTNHVIIWKIQF